MDDPSSNPGEAYRYAAFISYRHVEPDRRWSKWLHSALETTRQPLVPRLVPSTRPVARTAGN